jgi:glycerol kinase
VNILAIDQGTSSTTALVVGPGGEVLGSGRETLTTIVGAGGAVEQDPAALLDSVLAAGRSALADAGVPVSAVGLGNQGETVLRWDRASGEPFGNAISWQDRRAVDVTAQLQAHSDRLLEITGLPLDPYFAAPKMAWLRRREGAEGVITTVDAWVTSRLTGAFVTDAATASRTMLLDLDRVECSSEACEIFGLDPERQPEIVSCDATVGETDAFGSTLPVTGLAVDQQAALFAESCFQQGTAKCTYGTGAFVLANAGASPPRSASRLAACVAWMLGGSTTYCLDGQVYTAASAVTWLEQIGMLQGARQLDELCGDMPPSGDSPVFVPALAGLGAPYWAPQARGGWLGLSLASSRQDLVRAVVWGIAAQVAILADAMCTDAGGPLPALRVDGGLSRSRVLLQAQADLLQAPVELYPSPDATALGIAALARIGSSGASSPQDAVGDWRPAAVFEPRMSADEAGARIAGHSAAARALIGFHAR